MYEGASTEVVRPDNVHAHGPTNTVYAFACERCGSVTWDTLRQTTHRHCKQEGRNGWYDMRPLGALHLQNPDV